MAVERFRTWNRLEVKMTRKDFYIEAVVLSEGTELRRYAVPDDVMKLAAALAAIKEQIDTWEEGDSALTDYLSTIRDIVEEVIPSEEDE